MKNVLIILSLMPVFACTLHSQSHLPQQWQDGMTIKVSYGGGMRYYSYELLISDTGSYFMENNEGRLAKTSLALSREQLDKIMAFLRDKEFDLIQTEMTAPVHDKGTEQVTIQWGRNMISKGTGHAQEIKEAHKDRYLQVRNFLLERRLIGK